MHACSSTNSLSFRLSLYALSSQNVIYRIWSRMVSNMAMERARHAVGDVVRLNRTSNSMSNLSQRPSVALQLSGLGLLLGGVHVQVN